MELRTRRKAFVMAALLAVLALIASACGASNRVIREVEARDRNGLANGEQASASGGSQGGQLAEADGAGAAAGAAGATGGGSTSGGGGAAAAARRGPAAAPAAGPASQVVAGACAAAAPPGGNGGATDTGVSGDTIKVGGTFFNGNYLDKYSQVTEQAVKAYFQYTNDQGGICGRKIQFIACDTAGTADGTKGCLSKLADQDKVFTMGPSLDFNLNIVQPTLANAKLPWVGDSGLYGEEFQSPWMFPTQLNGTDVGALLAPARVDRSRQPSLAIQGLHPFVEIPRQLQQVEHLLQPLVGERTRSPCRGSGWIKRQTHISNIAPAAAAYRRPAWPQSSRAAG